MEAFPCLFVLVLRNQVQRLSSYLRRSPEEVDTVHRGETLLQFAIRVQLEECAYVLISAGANIHFRDSSGRNLLWDAGNARLYTIVNALINRGVNLHHRDNIGRQLIHYAIEDRDEELFRIIAEAGGLEHAYFVGGSRGNILHCAVFHDIPNFVKIVLHKKPDLNHSANSFGQIPLHLAKSVLITNLLLDAGADPAAEDAWGVTATTYARRNPHTRYVYDVLCAEHIRREQLYTPFPFQSTPLEPFEREEDFEESWDSKDTWTRYLRWHERLPFPPPLVPTEDHQMLDQWVLTTETPLDEGFQEIDR